MTKRFSSLTAAEKRAFLDNVRQAMQAHYAPRRPANDNVPNLYASRVRFFLAGVGEIAAIFDNELDVVARFRDAQAHPVDCARRIAEDRRAVRRAREG